MYLNFPLIQQHYILTVITSFDLIEMALAPLLLSTIAASGAEEAVVVWDPIAGNPIANFNGDVPAKSTLSAVRNLVFCGLAKKPILQAWSLQSVHTIH